MEPAGSVAPAPRCPRVKLKMKSEESKSIPNEVLYK